jgi:parvulin-like peptidyl-prolyl isomerase
MKKLFIIINLLFFVFAISGCKQKDESGKKSEANSLPKTVEPTKATAIPESVVATVNGQDITKQQLDEKIAAEVAKVKPQMPEPYLTQYKQQLEKKLLDEKIMAIILDEKVAENKIVVSDKEVDEHIANLNQHNGLTMQDFLGLLKAKGQSLDEYKQFVRKNLGYEKFFASQIPPVEEVNDIAARQYYDQHVGQFVAGDQVKISRIFIPLSSDANEQLQSIAMRKAQAAVSRIKKGEDIAVLAAEYPYPKELANSDGGFIQKGTLSPEIEKTVFAMSAGQVSGIIRSANGLEIIKVTGKAEHGTKTFDEAKPQIVSLLTQEKQKQVYQEYAAKLKKETHIVYKK